jgi:transcriptional regulator with XRE-family HTH domain
VIVYPNLLEWVRAAWRAKYGDKRLNVLELCRESGVTPPAFYRLEEGNPRPETVARLAGYFGVPEPQRAFLAEGIVEPAPTPLSLLRDAIAQLCAAEEMLEAKPSGPTTDALPEQAVEEVMKPVAPVPKGSHRASGTEGKPGHR